MVQEQVKPRDVHDERVLTAMAKVPREEFVPENLRDKSYADSALPIGHDQTISQPFIVAFMTEQLRPQPTDRVPSALKSYQPRRMRTSVRCETAHLGHGGIRKDSAPVSSHLDRCRP